MATLSGTRDQTVDDLERGSESLMPCLIHVLDRGAIAAHPGLTFPLAVGRDVAAGRGTRSEVVEAEGRTKIYLEDSTASGKHARMRAVQVGDTYELHVRDEGSRNGTFFNGKRVDQARLSDGDRLAIGSHTFMFRVVPLTWLTAFRRTRKPRAFLGQGVAVHSMYQRLERVAPSQVPVLLQGESGTGKELVARELHRLSDRRGPFVGINCGAIPENLIESELFGHAKGAFSGAGQARTGLIESANTGTLLLDEVGDMPASVQVRLLRVLQEGEVLPIGENRPRKVDVRVVAATHRALESLVSSGDFRGDLFARLRGFQLSIPALSERREDIGLLFAEGLRRSGADVSTLHLSAPAAQALLESDWPYNVRQVMQVASVAAALAEDGLIGRNHLQGLEPAGVDDAPKQERASEPDLVTELLAASRRRKHDPDSFRRLLNEGMSRYDGNVRELADALGVSRTQVYRWIKEVE